MAHDREAVQRGTPARGSSGKPRAGILAKPMPKWTILTGPTDNELKALIGEKFKALFAHYEIESDGAFEGGPKMASAWANLAFRLAREYVPGFREPPPRRGRPATRRTDDATLVMHVELLTRRDGVSARKAIKEIAAHSRIPGTEQTLRQRYKLAKQAFRPLSHMFDNVAAAGGRDALVQSLEESLSGDNKDIFLSPS